MKKPKGPWTFSFALIVLLVFPGCAELKQLRTDNTQLREEITRLKQIENDYSDQLEDLKRLSADEKRRLRAEMGEMRSRLSANLQDQVNQNNALVQKVKDLTVIEIGESALFGSGQTDLTRQGTKVIRQMTEVLNQYPGYQVRIEGHTDSVPIGKRLKSRFASNWELSTARATNVVKYMIYGLKVDPARLLAVGYAQYRPIASNDTKEGRAKNRRIRFVVYKGMEIQSAKMKR